MIPRFKPTFEHEEFKRIFMPASDMEKVSFTKEFAEFMQARYAHTYPYGRIGIYAFLKASDIQKKEIICPAYTCIVVAHAIEESGNQCAFVDVDPEDLNMNSELLRKSINSRTAAVVFTSLYGNTVRLDDIEFVKKNYPHIFIIHDSTHSMNAKLDGECAVKVCDAVILGLGISKPVSSVFGGILVTNNDELNLKLREFDNKSLKQNTSRSFFKRIYLFCSMIAFSKVFYAVTNYLERKGFLDYFVKLFDADKISIPKDSFERLSNFEASIGRIQLKKFTEQSKKIKLITDIYHTQIKNSDRVTKLAYPVANTMSHYNLLVERRDELMNFLHKHGFEAGRMYDYALPELLPYKKHPYFTIGNHSQRIAREIVNLPLCVSDDEARKISQLINFYC